MEHVKGARAGGRHRTIRPRLLRWAMIAFAFVATVINYLDRQTLSIAASVMRGQLHFGDLECSLIVSAFLFAYTIMNGVSGPLIDRLGTRRATRSACCGGRRRVQRMRWPVRLFLATGGSTLV